MGQAGPLRWRDGQGWLVLIGGGHLDETAEIERAAIELMSDEAPAVFVPAASANLEEGQEYGTRVVAQIERLGGPVGYVAPILSKTDAADFKNVRRLKQAGLIYVGGGSTRRLMDTLSGSACLEALVAAYQAGAVLAAWGEAVCALGRWGVCSNGSEGGDVTEVEAGWGWLPDALICPHLSEALAPELRKAVKSHPESLGVGIPDGTALVLGPENQVLTLGTNGKQVTVILGPRFKQNPTGE